jgi:hypothetical protein
LIVLPAAPSIEDLTAMARIAAKLGTYSSEDTVRIEAVAADRFSPQTTPTNVIAIGAPETNALIHTYDVQLPQPLSPVNGQVVSAPGRELSPEEQAGQAGYLEVMPSPWSRSDSFLVIGAHTPGLLLRVVEILPTGGTPMKQQGNVAVVTPTTVTGFSLGNFAGASLSSASRKAISEILIGAFVLIGLLGGLVVWRRRRGQSQKNDE